MADDSNQPATRGDLRELEQTLREASKSDLRELSTELKDDMHQLRTELKDDMRQLRTELKDDMRQLELRQDTKLDALRDEIIRALGVVEENILSNMAHVDEVQGLDNRLTRVEKHLGLDKQ